MCDQVLPTAASADFGLRRALVPFLAAVAAFAIQVVAVGSGLGILLARSAQLHGALQCAGAGCLLYLGWQLLRHHRAHSGAGAAFSTFGEAAALQFLNPKAWLMALATATLLLPAQWEQVLADGFAATI
jgi:threonine/homoserine/homoserine lactone efflux protein